MTRLMNAVMSRGRWMPAATLAGVLALNSCTKPLEGVSAILSNDYVAHTVAVQIVDARTAATDPYPANPVVTLSGDAVAQGLIYTSSGEQLDGGRGAAVVTKGMLGLAIRPYTVISPSRPIRFTISVEAVGYLPTSRQVEVTSVDSLQYMDLNMISLAAPPEGVSVRQAGVEGISNGVLAGEAVLANSNGANLVLPAGTSFRDASGNMINSTGTLSVVAAGFDTRPGAVTAIPGGVANVATTEGSVKTFVPGGVLDVNMALGGIAVKAFSKPVPVDIAIEPYTFNPHTKKAVAAGDPIEVWSYSGVGWKAEGSATLFQDNGILKARININRPATWMAAYSGDVSSSPLNISYATDAVGKVTHYMAVYAQGTSQLLAGRTVAVDNGDMVSLPLPAGMNYDLKLFEGTSSSTAEVETVHVAPGATTARVSYKKPVARPTLYFDLATKCQNGTFRYSGPVWYRVSGTRRWNAFTPAERGVLTTNLLDWDKTYDFMITYDGADWIRSRTVLKAEFREDPKANRWEFWGRDPQRQQKFFNAPTTCGK